MKNNLFIVVEGIDGVGKTSVARSLARRLSGRYLRTPPRIYGLTGKYIDQYSITMSHFLYYLSATVFVSERTRHLLTNSSVICDRYILTTSAFHFPHDLCNPVDIGKLKLLSPDFTFSLTASEPVRRERIRKGRTKKMTIIEKQLEDDPVFLQEVINMYRKHPAIDINTSHLTVTQVVDKIMPYIK